MLYSQLASIYDLLMEDINYQEWAEYLLKLMDKHDAPGEQVLDLGCGTGSISLLLAQKGLKLTCLDNSIDMLAQAEQKFRENNLKVLFYQQDIRNLVLTKQVDVVIATFDTLNYILKVEELQKTLKNIHQVLKDQGLLIFDTNTFYKLSHILGNNTFTYNTEEIAYIWENYFDFDSSLCEMDLTFFKLEEKTGKYLRFTETHTQRAYKQEEIETLLRKCGFVLVGIYGELKFTPPADETEKIFFVARKE